jgi:Protein of unknown function with PCYCGC motif
MIETGVDMKQESKRMARRNIIAIIAGVAGVAILIYVFLGIHQRGAAAQGPLTLEATLFKGDARKAYEVAREDPALLAQLHCYCGCEQSIEHKNLLDCFRSKHAVTCEICIGEAIEAERLAGQGLTADQISAQLRARFARGS